MRKLILAALVIAVLLPQDSWAKRKVVAANLTDNFVGVSEGFDGAKLTVFGVLKNKADAVVVIEGPPVEAKVRAKSRQLGVWVNGEPELIAPVPSFYAVVSSRPIQEVVNAETARTYGLDLDRLPVADTPSGAGYVAVKKAKGMFRTNPQGVQILESNLFRADIFLPPSVPIGVFQAHIYEFSNGKLSANREETFNVAQIGLNDSLNNMARMRPVSYALLSLALSLGLGAGAAHLFARRS